MLLQCCYNVARTSFPRVSARCPLEDLRGSERIMLPTLASFHNMLALWQRQQMAAARGYNAAIMLR